MNEIKTLYLAKIGNNNINIDTLLGPSCLGDLVMTCTSLNSRNLSFGFNLGSSHEEYDIQQILIGGKLLIEGVSTVKSTFDLTQKLGAKMPICEAIYRLLYESASIEDTISVLVN
ncbi:glycerol-3-phosphate dehydrogenase [Trichonephila inaurata madagascariensis]|uniref:Glycerol-3-phosphate dehydrogenase n=2 Tax=cellular organisms TaxID=131567 RepID=A0A8X7CG35_9ARAC|nr:glycerol-3-phosphate dehydrogenase [Trichonephila inaurata madagascariensis]